MSLVVRQTWDHCFILPTLWAAEEACDGCGAPGITLNLGFLFWSVGVSIHFHK